MCYFSSKYELTTTTNYQPKNIHFTKFYFYIRRILIQHLASTRSVALRANDFNQQDIYPLAKTTDPYPYVSDFSQILRIPTDYIHNTRLLRKFISYKFNSLVRN